MQTLILCFRGLRRLCCIHNGCVSGDYGVDAAYRRFVFQGTTELTLRTDVCFRGLQCLRCIQIFVCSGEYGVDAAYRCLCF